MPAGTITLTNGSTTVTGSGTTFTSELKVNDFIVTVIGGVTYTLGVQAIGLDTAVTLTTAFNGPTTSGAAWTAVPNATLVGITAQVGADVAKAIRGLNFEKANWQKIYSSDPSVTVNLPDLTQFSGPSWGYMAAQYANKANTSDVLTKADNLGGLTDKAAARTNLGFVDGALPIALGGTGTKSKTDAWTALATYGTVAGTAAQGNDSRLNTINGKTGGTISSAVLVSGTADALTFRPTNSSTESSGNVRSIGMNFNQVTGTVASTFEYYLVSGQYHSLRFIIDQATYSFRGTGVATAVSWTSTSDIRLKKNIKSIESALDKILSLDGFTYEIRGEPSAGVSAQALKEVLPEAVVLVGDVKDEDDNIISDSLGVNYGALTALVLQATKELKLNISNQEELIEKQNDLIIDLQGRMKAIDGLDA